MTSTFQSIKDSLFSSERQEVLYSTDAREKRAWPTASFWETPLDKTLIDLLTEILGVEHISLNDRLESDLGFDELDLADFHIKFHKAFKLKSYKPSRFETWGEICFALSPEHKAPYYDYSVAELLDMIVRSGIVKKPLSKKAKEELLRYDFTLSKRALIQGDKLKLRIAHYSGEPGVYFITDPFVLNCEQHDTVEKVMKTFYYEEDRKSDALFNEIVRSSSLYSVRYKSRSDILKSHLPYEKLVAEVQANYRVMKDGKGYYVLHTTNEADALKIAEQFRSVLINELQFVDLC